VGRATPLNDELASLATPRVAVFSRALGSSRPAGLIVLASVLILVSQGCSGRTSYINGGPSMGQLKTSLSHLEYENDQLKTQVARLKEENRTMEDRLVQEQMHTGALTAKLDDARNAMRDRGLDVEEIPAHPRTLPAGRRTSKPRKPPTAQISASSESEEDDPPPLTIEDDPPARPSRNTNTKTRSRRPADDSVSLNLDESNVNWLPVANGADAKGAAKR
jgi:hypothetical protein